MSRITLISAVLIGLLLNKPSLAQEFKEAPGSVLSRGKTGLLLMDSVRGDLGLTDEQMSAVRKIVASQSAMKRDLDGVVKAAWPEERPAKAAEVGKRLAAYSKEVDKKLQSVLAAAQIARLEEIYTQSRGLQALFDPAVADKIGLSDAQKERLADARKKHRDAFNAWAASEPELSPPGSDERKAWGEKRRAIQKEFDDSVLSSLTAEQLDQLKKLRGKLIDLSRETSSSARRGGREVGRPRGSQ
jgi:hypothetical protein